MITKSLTFSSKGHNYTATKNDIFMQNGIVRVFIRGGKDGDKHALRPHVSEKEWNRILSSLIEIDYEEYYGRKPLISGVSIYKLK